LSHPQDVQIYPGQGLVGTVNNKTVVLGNSHLIKDAEKYLFNNGTDNASGTFSYLQIDNKITAKFGFDDQLKDGVQDVINKLKSQGKRLVILSGDSTQAVQKIADKLGISEIHAQITPEKKLAFIEDVSHKNNNVVAMLGDGINDAAALSKAHIGIAMGNGTDLAMESADIVLVKGNIEAIPRLFSMSSSYISNIKQNLFLAFIYNVLAIPLAAGVLYESHGIALSPVIASIAMSASSISVIANALRLRWS
jgi:P-type E1-E2 ATPase